MKENPLVSVIIPAYNAERYVELAVRSIMNQTYTNLEIIITDDCSTDRTFEILKKLAEEDSRIKLFRNDKNLGIVDSLNFMIAVSCGEYIARMDADDMSLPLRIEKQVKYMQSHKNIMILGCNVIHIDENNKSIFKPIIPCSPIMVRNMRYFRICFYHPTVMVRAKIKNEYFYEKDFLYAEDYALWLKLLEKYRGANLRKTFLQYRIHKGQISKQKTDKQISVFLKIFKKYNFDVINDSEIELYARYIAASEVIDSKKLLKLLFSFFLKKKIFVSPLLFLTLAHKFLKAKKC